MKHTFWATIILLAILSTISAGLGRAQNNVSEGILMNGDENNTRPLSDIIQKVKQYRSDAILNAEAYLVSAEYHRSKDVRWGIVTVVLSTLVSTAVVTGLAKQFTLSNGSTPTLWSWETLVAFVISIPLVSAPILTAVYKSMHNAEDAASHNASATRYDRLARKYDLFLVEYTGADATKREAAIKALRELDTEYGNARENNITLTDEAIDVARRNLAKRQKADADGKDIG